MNITRAFSYAFDDRDWTGKLAMSFIVTAGAALFTPILVGLSLWAVLFGWMAELVRNLRAGSPRPLPAWSDVGALLQRGLPVLGAWIVYQVPNGLLACCLYTLAPSLNTSITGTSVTLGVACCVFPLLLVYNVISAPMFALGVGRYAEHDQGRINAFFEFGRLFGLVQAQMDATIQYLLSTLLAWLVFAVLALIPCIGWVAAPALIGPVLGMLMGQYASRVLGRSQRSMRPVPPPPPIAPYRRRG